jgi:hypothetical protein
MVSLGQYSPTPGDGRPARPAPCDHGPNCPVWSAQHLTAEDVALLQANGWTWPTQHVAPLNIPPPSPPRPRRFLAWWSAVTALWLVPTAAFYPWPETFQVVGIMLIPLGIYAWTLHARRSG